MKIGVSLEEAMRAPKADPSHGVNQYGYAPWGEWVRIFVRVLPDGHRETFSYPEILERGIFL